MNNLFLLFFLLTRGLANTNPKLSNFICSNGDITNIKNVCDGRKHCPDGSDEASTLCYHVICPANMSRCIYGACIDRAKWCDGQNDCADNSDESRCGKQLGSCEKTEFRCTSQECLSNEKICNGINECLDKSDESKELCEDVACPTNSFHCHHGGCIHKDALCDGYIDCADASDESETICNILQCTENCKEIKESLTCAPIKSGRINVRCEIKDGKKKGWIPCDKPVPLGTIAYYECKPYYVPANKKQEENKQMICQEDGSWSREILQCEPECGTNSQAVPLVVNGWLVETGKWPWHATLYLLEGGKWIQICGGSLIHERAVITAGHCVWEATPDTLKVALGKHFSDYNMRQDFTVVIQVEKIEIQPLYQDISGNYGSDIAILILEKAVKYSEFIKPVCLDWFLYDITEHLSENSLGMALGMGVTENDTFSDQLRAIMLPVVSEQNCIKEQHHDFKKYITYTSFCAGWRNGSGVCNGDSGGGFVLPKTNNPDQWVLQGIVSISPRRKGTSFCDTNYFTVFTKVGMYIDWIKEILNAIPLEVFPNENIIEDIVIL